MFAVFVVVVMVHGGDVLFVHYFGYLEDKISGVQDSKRAWQDISGLLALGV